MCQGVCKILVFGHAEFDSLSAHHPFVVGALRQVVAK